MARQPFKKWKDNKDKLKDDLDDACRGLADGEYVAVVVKVDPTANPISGYWIVKPPVRPSQGQ